MKRRLLALLLAALLLFSVPAQAEKYSGKRLYNAINDMVNYVVYNYHFRTTDEALLRKVMRSAAETNGGVLDFDNAMYAIFDSLDEYSEYYEKEDYDRLMEATSGSFSGIGIRYLNREDGILVVEVFENGPAKEAGIRRGDQIVSVDGVSVIGMETNELLSRIRGASGTVVEIGIKRGNSTVTVPVVRANVEEEEVTYEMLEGNTIGYISITSFNENTPDKMQQALKAIGEHGSKKIIFDLRDNPGGITGSALGCLDQLIPKGKTVLNVLFQDEEATYISENSQRKCPYKIVVLVNENTASAAEIFAGAMQDNGVATLVGQTTFGKGTMQEIRPLSTGGGIKLTIGEFFTPKGETIRDVGITPDIQVQNENKYWDEGTFQTLNLIQTTGIGTESSNVLGVEQRLYALGYFDEEPDNVYTQETALAVQEFQFLANLPLTGEANSPTLITLNNVEYDDILIETDAQLETAIDFLKK